jgi:hypothetical protein
VDSSVVAREATLAQLASVVCSVVVVPRAMDLLRLALRLQLVLEHPVVCPLVPTMALSP